MADNWYIALELEFDPPVTDEAVIAERIEERSRFWSSNFNDFKMGAQYRAWHQNIPKIKKDMLGEENVREQMAKEACERVYAPVDKLLNTIGRKGNVTSDEGEKIAKKLKISVDTVKKRAQAHGIKWSEESGSREYKALYDKYYKAEPQNKASFDNMKQQLASFGAEDLYEFLYGKTEIKNAKDLPCVTLRQRAAEKKKNEFYKTDSISGTGQKLCGRCEKIFKDENSKEIYDKYLEYVKIRSVLDYAKTVTEISGELTAEQGDEVIGQLTRLFRDKKLAEKVLYAFTKTEKISYNTEAAPTRNQNIKICRCGFINDVSDGRKICANCGLELVIKCPVCGEENDANIKVCKCGFRFENIDKALALCEQAGLALDTLYLENAKAYISDAETYWKGSRTQALKERLENCEQRVGAEVGEMRLALAEKRYCKAKEVYLAIQKAVSDYSDKGIEEQTQKAIDAARELFERAKNEKDEKKAMELCALAYDECADLPGISEMMPAPEEVKGLRAVPDPMTRTNVISWEDALDRSVRYIVVRSQSCAVDNPVGGETVYRGSAASFADADIEAGVLYHYNVFAERAGIYSKGAEGAAALNLFEIENVSVKAADSSLEISWEKLPANAAAEIYEITADGEKHIATSTSLMHTLNDLENDRQYRLRAALSYFVSGKKQETKGVTFIGIPTCPPLPVDTLRIRPDKDGRFYAMWVRPEKGEAVLLASTVEPHYRQGDVIPADELEQVMKRLERKPLPPPLLSKLKSDEDGAEFEYTGSETLYITAAVIRSGLAVFGNTARAGLGETVNVKAARLVNGKVNVYADIPKNASGFVILYRHDCFPSDIGDRKAVRKYIPIKQYMLNSAIVLDTAEEKKYYFSVFAEYRNGEDKDYSAGTDHLFDNTAKLNITYSVNVNKKIFGESSVILEFEADQKEFVLPETVIMSAVGNTPMFRDSAKLFFTVPQQSVSGKVRIKIPLPKDLPRDTYIKAFFKDDAVQKTNRLKLKLKSDLKIS